MANRVSGAGAGRIKKALTAVMSALLLLTTFMVASAAVASSDSNGVLELDQVGQFFDPGLYIDSVIADGVSLSSILQRPEKDWHSNDLEFYHFPKALNGTGCALA